MKKYPLIIAVLCLALFLYCNSISFAQELNIDWLPGPSVGNIGDDVAEIDVKEGYIFAGPKDTIKLMEYMGNPPSRNEAGFIAPKPESGNWFIVFDYYPIGYIPDDDKNKLDPDAILKSIQKGTDEGNKIREKNGQPKLYLKGWYEKPHYNDTTHNLVWAILAKDEQGNEIVNYNIRLLGRNGYMSAVLVADPSEFATYRDKVESIVTTFRYKQGKDYLSFVKGDNVAKYGLTALVAGGAGAAAAKFGFFAMLAKWWKAIALAIVAFFASIWKKIKNLLGINN